MSKKHRKATNDTGMALLTALMFISITVIVLTSLTARYIQQRLQVDRFEDYYLCFDAAEAAIQQGKTAVEGGETNFRIGIPTTGWEPVFDDNNMLILPGFDDTGIVPETFASLPGVEYIVYVHDWFNDGRDTNGDGIVDSDDEEGVFSIHAAARINNVVRQLEAVYTTRDFGIWNNAIFAGRGQSGRVINGNVKIHGSVHLLGDDLPEGGIAVEALDLSGGAMIRNDYTGIETALAQRVPPLRTTLYNGEEVPSLETELRVRRGIVALSGNSHVGVEWSSGMGYKGPVDGTYVTDGWGGNQGTRQVFSDNGTDLPYDLGNTVSLPGFEDQWRDPGTGDPVHNPSTGTWYTHGEYFKDVLVGGPGRTAAGGSLTGNVTIRADQGFYYNATTGQQLGGSATNDIVPNPNHHYILKKANSSVIQINGAIHINGNLNFPNRETLYYHGRAALMVEGNVANNAHLLTVNDPNNINNFVGSFPYTSCLGIMSRGNMELGESSQRMLLGAFYSASRVGLSMQTQLMGTIVGRDFQMGSQVPDIFQVPVLAKNLPLGMIGDFSILRLSSVSWREIGI